MSLEATSKSSIWVGRFTKDIKQAIKESLPTAFVNEANIDLILTDAIDMDEFGSMVDRAEELCYFVNSLELNKT